MKKSQLIAFIVAAVVIAAGSTYAYKAYQSKQEVSRTAMMSHDKSMKEVTDPASNSETASSAATTSPGQYIAYDSAKLVSAKTGKVVIFFAASWCPTCRALDKDITSNLSNIPPNVTLLKADYDKETALKQKYGVTYQHTLVQVDENGNLIKKWSGSPTLGELLTTLGQG
jgi:thioredoxin 1